MSPQKRNKIKLVDTGLRCSEASALNWGDVDFKSGLVRVVREKGGKARSVVAGALTRRALLAAHYEENAGGIPANGGRYSFFFNTRNEWFPCLVSPLADRQLLIANSEKLILVVK